MNYVIEHETRHRLRLRSLAGGFSAQESEVLQFALSQMKGVKDVSIYRATGGIALTYEGDRNYIISRLDSLQYKNVTLFAEKLENKISKEELLERKLDSKAKRSLRKRILVEAAADLILPAPVQLGYHMYQLITLKEL